MIKVLYLYNGSRYGLLDKIKKGNFHANGFWGMTYLSKYGISASYLELEQYLPLSLSRIIRRFVNVYFIHLPLFFKFFSYDIIFSSSAFGSQFVKTIFNIKSPLWVMHDFSITGLIGDNKTIKQKIFKYLVSRCDGIVTLSLKEKERLENMFPGKKIDFIPFGVDLDFFKPKNIPESNYILAVGFDPDRDWCTLIEAVKDVDIEVIIATREERVKKFYPLPNNIKIKQFIPKDLVVAYEQAKIVIVPLNTSFGNNNAMGCSTLFEGMAMAKPVIITETSITKTYVNDMANGCLVKEGDVFDLRTKINLLLADNNLRNKIGNNAYLFAKDNLDADVCAGKLASFFKGILNTN